MKKIFMFSIVLTALLFGSKVFAAEIVTDQDIYINGEKAEMSAINYNDNNYVKLRDIVKVLNIEIPRTDINKQKTNFAKELLVPGSTQ